MSKQNASKTNGFRACKDPWPRGGGVRRINLALQGGGAHGAFTWGVLDRLLEDERIAIEAITGTSAGAVNGTVMAYGLTVGGREEARRSLRDFWERVSQVAALSPLQPSALDRLMGPGRMDYSPGYWVMDMMSRVFSPYHYNIFDLNPLRDILGDMVDFEVLRDCRSVKLFVSATNVKRGRIKVFDISEMELDAVIASTCLPFLHQAVEIGEDAYWDGGYMGNPAIYPLIYHADCPDILLVQLNPINSDTVPTSAQEIMDRLNVLTFNASLMREMRAINFVTRLIDDGFDHGGRLKRLLLHVIHAEDVMAELGVSSKLNADRAFLEHLFEVGRARTETWLAAHFDRLGQESTIDIEEMYL
ncbi:MAG: patatin-like phospholipase family protein [Kiloniellales bacterium]|nr:patatin-like phospholipase family protein [Kiloniellales bacterium]